jgi:hypothetical protein
VYRENLNGIIAAYNQFKLNFNIDERINVFLMHKVKKGDGDYMKCC